MMNLKKNILISLTVFLTILAAVSFGANSSSAAVKASKQAQETQTAKVTSLKTRADAEIARRTRALNQVDAIINRLKRLSTDQKTSFSQQINQNIDDLNSLKAKIDADTELTILKSDVQSIIANYRIFALFIPKAHLLASTDMAAQINDSLTALAAKLSARVDAIVAAGQDATTLKADLADMNSKIADSKTKVEQISTTVTPLTPDGYPGNKTTLQSSRALLQNVRADISTARQDAESMAAALANIKTSSSTNSTEPAAS